MIRLYNYFFKKTEKVKVIENVKVIDFKINNDNKKEIVYQYFN